MINVGKGIISGLVASAAVSATVFLGPWISALPAPDPIRTVSGIMLSPIGLGWVVHFAIGAFLWGPLFAVLSPVLPPPFWFKGVTFGMLAWLLMLFVTWVADPGAPPRPSLEPVLLHFIFGAVLGSLYGTLLDRTERQASAKGAT